MKASQLAGHPKSAARPQGESAGACPAAELRQELGLRAIRESLGMTQNDVAGRIEVDQGQLSRLNVARTCASRRFAAIWGRWDSAGITAVAGDKRIVIRREHAHR